MKVFKVVNTKLIDEKSAWGDNISMIITLNNPPYENEDIFSHIKWKEEDCIVTEIKSVGDNIDE